MAGNGHRGRLANAELREAKKEANFYFDQIAKTNLINKIWSEYLPGISNRNKAYLWLSNQLGIPREVCHIGMFDVEDCKRVVELCKPIIKEYRNEKSNQDYLHRK